MWLKKEIYVVLMLFELKYFLSPWNSRAQSVNCKLNHWLSLPVPLYKSDFLNCYKSTTLMQVVENKEPKMS